MSWRKPKTMLRGGAAGFLLLALSVAEVRGDVADFYKGKQLNVIVGTSAGGGYNLYARVLAKHFGRYVPGNPSIVVQNMPGAGGLRAANYLYKAAPKDGTTFGIFAHDLVLLGALGHNTNVQFQPPQFT